MSPTEFERNLKIYAEIAIRIGVNLQPGQRLLISAPVENAPLVYALTQAAYEVGAHYVDIAWWDERVLRIRYEGAGLESMDEVNERRPGAMARYLERGDAVLAFSNPNPDLAAGVDPEKVVRYQMALGRALRPWRDLRGMLASNCALITAPTAGWAAKVLPDLPPEQQVDSLWQLIFELCRVFEHDPVAAWKDHNQVLTQRRNYLNQKRYRALVLRAPGTDLRVGLPDGHIWSGGSKTTRNGIEIISNLPTEEVYTLPHREHIEGVLRATKPLNFGGYMDSISLIFKEGRIVDASAQVGGDFLHKIIQTDNGASRIGEIALVPHSSPISQTGRVFHNILIDENASCHMAIGSAYRFSLEGSQEMSEEQFMAAGGNVSSVHVDFMIGSHELDVDGITQDGKAEAVMRAGEFVMEL